MGSLSLTLPTAVSTAPVSVGGGTPEPRASTRGTNLIVADNLGRLLDKCDRNAARSNIPEYGRIYFAHLADRYREALRAELKSI